MCSFEDARRLITDCCLFDCQIRNLNKETYKFTNLTVNVILDRSFLNPKLDIYYVSAELVLHENVQTCVKWKDILFLEVYNFI